MAETGWLDKAFEAVAIDDEGRACRDIPESACQEEAGNFFQHVGALTLSKSADALIDPKLVLSWLMNTLGTPSSLVGLLVPIREAGALMQGLSAISIAFAALTLEGAQAGWAILAALAVLALSRSVCSVCYKDVLGKTVSKSRRCGGCVIARNDGL